MEQAVVLDVRPYLQAGQDPFHTIMAAVENLAPGQELVLIAPFEPRPLYKVLAARGFDHRTEENEDGDWRVTFFRRPPAGS